MATHKLTQADLIVLSLLLERPMHGYDLVQEYERQEVRDWASVSKAQVYYALKKLEDEQLIRADKATVEEDARRKTIYFVTSEGSAALEEELEKDFWITQRRPQPFSTWVGLSIHCNEQARAKMFARRKKHLEAELMGERESYEQVTQMTSERARAGMKIIGLKIATIETELAWLISLDALA